MDYAWLAPVLPIGAFALNVLIWRQMGARKHALSALTTLAAIGAHSWSFSLSSRMHQRILKRPQRAVADI